MKYYKSNDNHLYKVDGLGGVLHVNKSALLLNVIHHDVFEDTVEIAKNNHTPLTEISYMDFMRAYDMVQNAIQRVANR